MGNAVAEVLARNQSAVAALERRGAMVLSTLRRYIESLGAEVEVVTRFPERPSVRLKVGR